MDADAASLSSSARHSQRRGWLGTEGGEGGREGDYFWHQQKYLRRHLAALFICRALLHHNRRAVVSGACACSHVCTCTHPALCTAYTHGDTVCTHTHRPPPACLGALPCPGHSLGLKTVAQLPKIQAPATLPAVWVVPRGQDGHCQPRALCRELGQLSPWGCTVLAQPVPWQEGGSATSRAEPRAPVTPGAPGQGANSPPAREQSWSGREKRTPSGMASPRAGPCPQLAPLQWQRLPRARLARWRQAAGQGRQLLRMELRRAAGGFVGGPGLLTLCTAGVVNGPAQLQSCPSPDCPSQEPAGPCSSAGTALR